MLAVTVAAEWSDAPQVHKLSFVILVDHVVALLLWSVTMGARYGE